MPTAHPRQLHDHSSSSLRVCSGRRNTMLASLRIDVVKTTNTALCLSSSLHAIFCAMRFLSNLAPTSPVQHTSTGILLHESDIDASVHTVGESDELPSREVYTRSAIAARIDEVTPFLPLPVQFCCADAAFGICCTRRQPCCHEPIKEEKMKKKTRRHKESVAEIKKKEDRK